MVGSQLEQNAKQQKIVCVGKFPVLYIFSNITLWRHN